MKNNYIYIIDNKESIKDLEKDFKAFPLKSFSVGFNNYYDIKDIIYDNSFLYINRLLPSNELDNLKVILNNLPSNIIGILFDDLGVLEITKDLNIKKIFIGSHILNSSLSIKSYLNYVDNCIISHDISLDEIDYITNNIDKKLCLFGYGHIPLSYSRRKLNTSYANYYNLENHNNLNVTNTNHNFIFNENEYGTVTYAKEVYNILNKIDTTKYEYILINLFNITLDDFKENKLINDTLFIDNKTIYKLGDKND